MHDEQEIERLWRAFLENQINDSDHPFYTKWKLYSDYLPEIKDAHQIYLEKGEVLVISFKI